MAFTILTISIFLLAIIPSAFAAQEQDPFVSGGVGFIEDVETYTLEVGAEIAPHINWSLGYSTTFEEHDGSQFASVYPTTIDSWGLHTAIGYEFNLTPTFAITPRVGLTYNAITMQQTDPETSEILREESLDEFSPTLGVKIDIGRVGVISEFYKVDLEHELVSDNNYDDVAVRIMAAYNF
ncbi:porin family protein [Vibrio sp. T187]|uniref:outer membrane beta-barrel protein n=1 Tax=Vibrio TaxID=662 RepID=UPI0010C94656|nr:MULTISPECIES: outer membrane beta-barrel protein [Vibrio]MBW3696014.1 porin family protein [Vibrio sp. T187]